MIIQRWQAPITPSIDQLKMILHSEGLEIKEEVYEKATIVKEHKHPWEEVRIIISGELIYNLSGNKILLRPGDKIVIPPHTRHTTEVMGTESCKSLVGFRAG